MQRAALFTVSPGREREHGMADAVCVGTEVYAGSVGFGGRLEVLEGPSGRRRWPEALKGRIVAESFAPGARVCDVARRHRIAGQQLTAWRRAARDGSLALPSDAVGPGALGLVSLEVDTAVEIPEETASAERLVVGPGDRIEIVAGGVLVRLPVATAAARVAEIAAALGARP
jgi:transposase